MPIRIRCPKCKQLLQVPSRYAGQVVKCVKCEAKLRIPEVAPAKDAPAGGSSAKPNSDRTQSAPQAEPPGGYGKPAAHQPLSPSPGGDWSMDLAPPASTGAEAPGGNWSLDFDAPGTPAARSQPTESPGEDWSFDLSRGPASREEYDRASHASPPGTHFAYDEEVAEDEEFQIRAARGEVEEMDLTPMVDVTFLLLIFFMITASFSMQKSLQIPPPDPEKEGAQQSMQMLEDFEEYSVIVQIDAQNRIFVDYEELSDPRALIDLFEEKRASEQKNELIVEADAEAFNETVVTVIDAANQVGMQQIRIATSGGSGS